MTFEPKWYEIIDRDSNQQLDTAYNLDAAILLAGEQLQVNPEATIVIKACMRVWKACNTGKIRSDHTDELLQSGENSV